MKIQNEEAVSPVIGVILMVAITVILAAVIAAFVFGLAGTTGTSKNVGLTVAKNGTDQGFDVTVQGGTDINTLDLLEFQVNSSGYGNFSGNPTDFGVGDLLWTGAKWNTNTRFMVRGTFSDGSEQVLFDRQY